MDDCREPEARRSDNAVTRFIALTEFARAKFVEAGLPAEKITVKGNFVEDIAEEEVHEGERARGRRFCMRGA